MASNTTGSPKHERLDPLVTRCSPALTKTPEGIPHWRHGDHTPFALRKKPLRRASSQRCDEEQDRFDQLARVIADELKVQVLAFFDLRPRRATPTS